MKERDQNPVVGDTIRLRLLTYNSNSYTDVSSINKVEVYLLDPASANVTNKDGRILIDSFSSGSITQSSSGQYYLDLATSKPNYSIGKYLDKWSLQFTSIDEEISVENKFEIFPDLWYTSTLPAVYSFDFSFQPNKIRQGSIKWLIIQITPNIPRATDLERYYTNLAISADISISMEQVCGACVPQEEDLRTILDNEPISYRSKLLSYYLLDTTELDCGVYNVWFTMNFAGTTEVSPKMNLQIY